MSGIYEFNGDELHGDGREVHEPGSSPDQGKPSVCPTCSRCGEPMTLCDVAGWKCLIGCGGQPTKMTHPCDNFGYGDLELPHSSPVPATTTKSDTALQGLVAVLRFALDRPNDQTWRPNAERAIKLASAPQAVPAATTSTKSIELAPKITHTIENKQPIVVDHCGFNIAEALAGAQEIRCNLPVGHKGKHSRSFAVSAPQAESVATITERERVLGNVLTRLVAALNSEESTGMTVYELVEEVEALLENLVIAPQAVPTTLSAKVETAIEHVIDEAQQAESQPHERFCVDCGKTIDEGSDFACWGRFFVCIGCQDRRTTESVELAKKWPGKVVRRSAPQEESVPCSATTEVVLDTDTVHCELPQGHDGDHSGSGNTGWETKWGQMN